MSKSTNRSSSKGGSKSNTPTNNSGRPRGIAPKAGATKNRTRYETGGNLCW